MRLSPGVVHVFTGLGAACALLAGVALLSQQWEQLFLWLGLAFVIDAIDGPFARWADVENRLPRFSGERLDLVIDYVTYVFIPALALVHGGYLAGAVGLAMAIAIVLSSLFHFSDLDSKDDHHRFVGFPAIWNVVAFYLFAFAAPAPVAWVVVATCVLLTFLPLKWVHPMRVVALRPVTLVFTLLWAVAAVWAVIEGFPAPPGIAAVLLAVAAYGIALSLLWREGKAG